jgi:hypothetical protein
LSDCIAQIKTLREIVFQQQKDIVQLQKGRVEDLEKTMEVIKEVGNICINTTAQEIKGFGEAVADGRKDEIGIYRKHIDAISKIIMK